MKPYRPRFLNFYEFGGKVRVQRSSFIVAILCTLAQTAVILYADGSPWFLLLSILLFYCSYSNQKNEEQFYTDLWTRREVEDQMMAERIRRDKRRLK